MAAMGLRICHRSQASFFHDPARSFLRRPRPAVAASPAVHPHRRQFAGRVDRGAGHDRPDAVAVVAAGRGGRGHQRHRQPAHARQPRGGRADAARGRPPGAHRGTGAADGRHHRPPGARQPGAAAVHSQRHAHPPALGGRGRLLARHHAAGGDARHRPRRRGRVPADAARFRRPRRRTGAHDRTGQRRQDHLAAPVAGRAGGHCQRRHPGHDLPAVPVDHRAGAAPARRPAAHGRA